MRHSSATYRRLSCDYETPMSNILCSTSIEASEAGTCRADCTQVRVMFGVGRQQPRQRPIGPRTTPKWNLRPPRLAVRPSSEVSWPTLCREPIRSAGTTARVPLRTRYPLGANSADVQLQVCRGRATGHRSAKPVLRDMELGIWLGIVSLGCSPRCDAQWSTDEGSSPSMYSVPRHTTALPTKTYMAPCSRPVTKLFSVPRAAGSRKRIVL